MRHRTVLSQHTLWTLTGTSLLLVLAGQATQAQDFSLSAHFGEVTLSSGFTPDPHVIQLSAGGSSNASDADSSCVGNISNAPDYKLNYTAGNWPLGFFVDSEVDTTLLINDPQGNWHCNDDSEFLRDLNPLNPGVQITNPTSGRYDIWVGVWNSDNNFSDATLVITEYSTDSWAGLDIGTRLQEEEEFLNIAPYFGDDSGLWPNDGQCDDPRFSGRGMADRLVNYSRLGDATDCNTLFNSGRIEENDRYLQRFTGRLSSSDPVMDGRGYYTTRTFDGVRGERVLLDLRSQDFDTYLIIRGPGGWEDRNDDFGDITRSLLLVDIEEPGEYEVIVTSFSSGATGNYELLVDRVTDFNAFPDSLALNGYLGSASKIEPEGGYFEEAFEFFGRAGTAMEISLSSSDFDPFIELSLPDGSFLDNASWEGSTELSRIQLELPDDGIYTVLASALHLDASGDFRLEVSPWAPQAQASTPAEPIPEPALPAIPETPSPPVEEAPSIGTIQFDSKH